MNVVSPRLFIAGITLCLAACGSSSVAQWVLFHFAQDATIYTDPATVHKEGNQATMSVLIDYKMPQPDKTGKQVLSDKLYYQYNCEEKTETITATTAYAGPMASGEIVNENPDAPQVTAIDTGTLAEDMWKHACGDATAK